MDRRADRHPPGSMSQEGAPLLELMSRLTSSEQAMSSLGSALAGPILIVASLQAAGVVPPHSGQTRVRAPQQYPPERFPLLAGVHMWVSPTLVLSKRYLCRLAI